MKTIDSQISYTSDFWEDHSKPCDYINTSTRFPLDNNENYILYPNPVNAYLSIECKDEHKTESLLEIFSLSGKLILRKNFTGRLINIDVSEFSRGVYLVKLMSENQKVSLREGTDHITQNCFHILELIYYLCFYFFIMNETKI